MNEPKWLQKTETACPGHHDGEKGPEDPDRGRHFGRLSIFNWFYMRWVTCLKVIMIGDLEMGGIRRWGGPHAGGRAQRFAHLGWGQLADWCRNLTQITNRITTNTSPNNVRMKFVHMLQTSLVRCSSWPTPVHPTAGISNNYQHSDVLHLQKLSSCHCHCVPKTIP